jgi:hypothetical protein
MQYDLNFATNTLAFVAVSKMKQHIFLDRNFNPNRQVFTPATRRKELQQARVIREKRKQEEHKNMSIKDLLNARLKESQQQTDSTRNQNNPQPLPDSLAVVSDTVSVAIAPDSLKNPAKTDVVNTDNYQFDEGEKKTNVVSTDNYKFEDEAVKPNQPSESFLTRYMKAREKSRITGPFPYETKFSADNLVTSLVIDQLRGLGILLEAQMNDMLESYRFNGGIMSTLDLRHGEVGTIL